MRANEIITEGLSDIVYHYTNSNNALSILNNDEFKLAPTFKNSAEADINSKKLFFLSVTRSRTGSFHATSNSGVLFTLDGKKLGHNYKARPVDYWGPAFRQGDNHEMEDRILSNDSTIPALKYIKEISIIEKDSNFDRPEYFLSSFNIYSYAKKHNIPVTMYRDSKSWISGNKKLAMDWEEIKKRGRAAIESEGENWKSGARPHVRGRRVNRNIGDMIELLKLKDLSKVSKSAKELAERIFRKSYDNEIQTVINADIHNHARSKEVQTLGKVMKELKITRLNDVLEYIIKIYAPQLEAAEKKHWIAVATRVYVGDKGFYDDVNAAIAGTRPFDKEKYSDRSHLRNNISNTIYNLDTMGTLSDPSSVMRNGRVNDDAVGRIFDFN
jgi:hypothetical protein